MKTFSSAIALTLASALIGCAATPEVIGEQARVSQAAMVDAVKIESAEATYNDNTYALSWQASDDTADMDIFVSASPEGTNAQQIADDVTGGKLDWTPEDGTKHRRYFVIQPEVGDAYIVATRELPLEQASNFRDIGGYTTKDGKQVKWGRAYRSGAMPLLTEADYAFIEDLDLDSVVDFRSLDEREVTPDLVDDRTGAFFIANDYSMAPLMKGFAEDDGENMYAKMEAMLRPQYRSMIRRILADEGAVLYHCSAGQDRTGVATAIIYDVLGVDRETIVKDYHLSTELRQTKWEMPDINPDDYPGNFIVKYYVASRAKNEGPNPLYTPSGVSHIVQFFDYLDAEFGSSEGYLKEALGFSDEDIEHLRETMLD